MTSSTGTISKNTVIIKRLRADHGQQGFKNFLPLRLLVQSKWHGSSARMTNTFANYIKLR